MTTLLLANGTTWNDVILMTCISIGIVFIILLVLVGMVWGCVMGCISYIAYNYVFYKHSPRINYISSQYTKTGYSYGDIDFVISIMAFTVAMVTIFF